MEKLFQKNKLEYEKCLEEFLKLSKEINLSLDKNEILEGCRKEYRKELPWGKGKNNEWKDFITQIGLKNWSNKNADYTLYVLSGDKDFANLKENNININTYSKSHLEDFKKFIFLLSEKVEEVRERNKEELERQQIIMSIYNEVSYEVEEAIYQIAKEEYPEISNIEISDIKLIDMDISDVSKNTIFINIEADISVDEDEYATRTYCAELTYDYYDFDISDILEEGIPYRGLHLNSIE